MSFPLVEVVEDVVEEVVDEPFFLRRIMRGADLVVVGAEAAGDGSASVVVMVMMCCGFCVVGAWMRTM